MQYVLIVHEVADYLVWKKVFDEAAGIRNAAGELRYQLLQFAGEPNHIVHFSQWSSLDAARKFFESLEVAAIRKEAGVKAPEFRYLQELESGIL